MLWTSWTTLKSTDEESGWWKTDQESEATVARDHAATGGSPGPAAVLPDHAAIVAPAVIPAATPTASPDQGLNLPSRNANQSLKTRIEMMPRKALNHAHAPDLHPIHIPDLDPDPELQMTAEVMILLEQMETGSRRWMMMMIE